MPLSGIGLCEAESITPRSAPWLGGEEGDRRGRQHADPEHVGAGAGQPGDHGGLEHLAAGPGVPADDGDGTRGPPDLRPASTLAAATGDRRERPAPG